MRGGPRIPGGAARIASTWPTCWRCGGQMAARISGFDWSRTPLGPLEEWPISLRVRGGDGAREPVPDDAVLGAGALPPLQRRLRPGAGGKHPAALGQPAPSSGRRSGRSSDPSSPTSRRQGRALERAPPAPDGPKGLPRGDLLHVFLQPRPRRRGGDRRHPGHRVRRRRSRSRTNASCRCSATSAPRDRGRVGRGGLPDGGRGARAQRRGHPLRAIYLLRPGRDDAELVASAGIDRYEGPANPSFDPQASSHGWPLADGARAGELRRDRRPRRSVSARCRRGTGKRRPSRP